MADNDVKITLTIDDQGTVEKIQETSQQIQALGEASQEAGAGFTDMAGKGSTAFGSVAEGAGAAAKSLGDVVNASEGATGSFMALGAAGGEMVGVMAAAGISLAALAGGVAVAATGTAAFYGGAVKMADDYNVKILTIAANLLNKTMAPPEEAMQAWAQYKNYVTTVAEELQKEAGKHFAGGEELLNTFAAISKFGLQIDANDQQQIKDIGIITDEIKLLHHGYADINATMLELRGVFQGYAGMHYQLGQIIQQQIGANWKEVVQEHIKDGTIVEFLASQFKALGMVSEDIQGTLMSQATTLESKIGPILRAGVAPAYADIVGYAKEINTYLESHSAQLVGGIKNGWEITKELVVGTYNYIKLISDIVSTAATWTINVAVVFNDAARMALALLHPEFHIKGIGADMNPEDVGMPRGTLGGDKLPPPPPQRISAGMNLPAKDCARPMPAISHLAPKCRISAPWAKAAAAVAAAGAPARTPRTSSRI